MIVVVVGLVFGMSVSAVCLTYFAYITPVINNLIGKLEVNRFSSVKDHSFLVHRLLHLLKAFICFRRSFVAGTWM